MINIIFIVNISSITVIGERGEEQSIEHRTCMMLCRTTQDMLGRTTQDMLGRTTQNKLGWTTQGMLGRTTQDMLGFTIYMHSDIPNTIVCNN